MSPAWTPVLLAAVIVLGVVGGTVVQTILKELLPLLRTIAERQALSGRKEAAPASEAVAALERRVAELERTQRGLKEQGEFLQKLVEERPSGSTLPSGD